jgi:hypothetical protein
MLKQKHFSIGERVVIQDREDGKKYEGVVKDVTWSSDVGTWYLIDYHVGNKKHLRAFHSFDVERIDE